MKTLFRFLLLKLLVFPAFLLAQGPHWWYEYEVIGDAPADDFAAVNQGQLKHMSSKAYEYLLDYLPGDPQDVEEALEDIEDLIDSWASPGSDVDDYEVINLGQLKKVASLFYDVLIEKGFHHDYPWEPEGRTGFPDDYAMANVGQLKQLFSFDIVYPVSVELSSDLIINVSRQAASGYWQWIAKHNVPSGQDGFDDEPSNDGIPNLFKYAMGMDPFDPESSWASMPVGEFIEYDGIEYFAKTFDRPIEGRPDVEYILEISYDLNEGFHLAQEPVTLTDEDCVENPGPGDFECDLEDLEEGFERVWMYNAADPDPENEYDKYFTQIRINFVDDPDCSILDLLAPDSNIVIQHPPELIGDPGMHTCFHDGLGHGIGIDEGHLFSTGIAEEWNQRNALQENSWVDVSGDDDIAHWMSVHGFDEQEPSPLSASIPGYPSYTVDDATGVVLVFDVEFDDPLVETGELKVPFIFASDEYYDAPDVRNDGVAIFLYEIDEGGNVLPYTRTNIALLPATETRSRGINVFNAGDSVTGSESGPYNPVASNNVENAGFIVNSRYDEHYHPEYEPDDPPCDNPSPSPCDFGYSGFTSLLVAEGGVLSGLEFSSVLKQAETVPSEVDDAGWGGVIFRGDYRHEGNALSGYVIAFGKDDGDEVFTLYKLENHHGWERIIPNTEHPDFPEESVTVLDSIEVSDFQYDEWYTIKVSVNGNKITVKYWEGDEAVGPYDGIIQFTDNIEPLSRGFLGAIHIDEGHFPATSPSHLKWDSFDAESFTDFSDDDLGEIPTNWSGIGGWFFEYSVVADGTASGGRVLDYENRQENENIQVLVWHGREKSHAGVLEAGKRYMLKVVVADAADRQRASAALLKKEGIWVDPVE